MEFFRAHRRLSWIVAAALVVVVGGAVWLWTLPSNSDGLSLGDYGPDKQREWAERLVSGLNTHDANQVPVLRLNGKLSIEQHDAIEAVLPKPDCIFDLVSVRDVGKQAGQQIPGLSTVDSTYRFDVAVDERCAGREAGVREISIVAIAEMGYWEPYLLGAV